ncbi:MAG TPA: hypothetical protein VGF56_09295 [Rhizomicrobium sp.]|jgi:hypothetical protein
MGRTIRIVTAGILAFWACCETAPAEAHAPFPLYAGTLTGATCTSQKPVYSQNRPPPPPIIVGYASYTGPCVTYAPPTPSVTFPSGSTPVTFIAPTGSVVFQFNVLPGNQTIPLTCKIVVTATDPVDPSVVQTASGTVTVSGSAQTLNVPINLDSAGNTITFSFFTSTSNRAVSIDAPNPATLSLAVTPIAGLQLEVLPVAILYSPLGNGTQAKSSLTMTTSTGSTATLSTTATQGTESTDDDKETLTTGVALQIGSSVLSGKMGYSETDSWDQAVTTGFTQQNVNTFSLVTSESEGLTFNSGPPSGLPSIPNITTVENEPFWQDKIIVAIHAQYAIWDYPAGVVVQPIGSALMADLPLQKLAACRANPETVSANGHPSDPNDPHYIAYATGSTNAYVFLSSVDCTHILQLDRFWVAKSQAVAPLSYSVLAGSGSLDTSNAGESFIDTSQSTSTATVQQQSTFTSKVTSTLSNTAGVSVTESLMTIGVTDATTGTSVKTATVSYQATGAQQTQNTVSASTTAQDGSGAQIGARVLKDRVFQGLAIQVPQFNFPTAITWTTNTGSSRLAIEGGGRKIDETQAALPELVAPTPQQRTASITRQKQIYTAAASRHFKRQVPQAAPAYVTQPSAGDVIRMLAKTTMTPEERQRIAKSLPSPAAK